MWEGYVALPFVLETKVLLLVTNLEMFANGRWRCSQAKPGAPSDCAVRSHLHHLQRGDARAEPALSAQGQATDVLTFVAFDDGPKLAGDIAISAEIAAANAAELGHSTETELKILILHGLLHLAGYDHETDDGEMQAREAELRQQLKLPVGLIERAHGSCRFAAQDRASPPNATPDAGRRR